MDTPTPELMQRARMEERVIEVLRTIYDPELPVNIYDLGLIYGVEVDEDLSVAIRMTLTAPACPAAETLPGQVEGRVAAIPGVNGANVELVWDPPFSRDMISEEARLELGLF